MRLAILTLSAICGISCAWGDIDVSPHLDGYGVAKAEIQAMYKEPLEVLIPFGVALGDAPKNVSNSGDGPFVFEGKGYLAELVKQLPSKSPEVGVLMDLCTTRSEIGPAPEFGLDRVVLAVRLHIKFPSGEEFEGRGVIGSEPYNTWKHWNLGKNADAIRVADVAYWKALLMALIDVNMQKTGKGRLQDFPNSTFIGRRWYFQ